MSRDKQIEEMAKDICHLGRKCPDCSRQAMCKAMNYASRFYAKGYRKTADVAEEIFAEIENALELLQRSVKEGRKNDGIKYQQLHDGRILSIEAIKYFTAELKKKYTEGKKNDIL